MIRQMFRDRARDEFVVHAHRFNQTKKVALCGCSRLFYFVMRDLELTLLNSQRIQPKF